MTRRTGKHHNPRLNDRCAAVSRAAVSRAGRLLDEGREAEARALLEGTLPPQPPAGAAPDRRLIDAAVVWVHATREDPDTYPARLTWARYAYHASRALPGTSADLDRRQDSIDAYASALNRLEQYEEAFAVCREGIDLAFARGDVDDVLDRRIVLATGEYDRRCDAAGRDALTALTERHARHPDTSIISLVQTVPILLGLETCHRHDQADTVAAWIRVTDLDDTSHLDAILDSIGAHTGVGVHHTARVHADTVCARADCPVQDPNGATPPAERQRAMTARLLGLLLTGYDPDSAAPHPVLIKVASRYTAVADPNPGGHTPPPTAWARYAHEAVLQVPRLGWAQAITATRAAAGTLQRLGHPHEADQAWQRLAAFTDRLDADDTVTCRIATAEEHYHDGRCEQALATATTAVTAWRAQQTHTSPAGTIAVVRAEPLFDGCHRHGEHPDSHPIDISAFTDGDNATLFALYCQGLTVMAEHARTYHPDDACTDQTCREELALAADIPHRQLLRTVTPRYEEGHYDEVSATIGEHLATVDPAASPVAAGLSGLALLYCDSAAFTARTGSDPDRAAALRPSVLAWARYARRAADELDPTRAQWISASRAVMRAVGLCGAHTDAIQVANEVLDHQLAAHDTAGAITARLDLADALHAAGRCDEAATEADTAWTAAQRHYNPANPEERFTALLVGLGVGALHGDCHRHQQAADAIDTAVRHYTADPDTGPPVHDREHRWRAANAAIMRRRERHAAAYHPDGTCGQHEAQIAALVHRMCGDRLTGAPA
ncbi:hypothetical protein Daura_23020 [Dactylosporangium aurantiacum]|uniref:Tetratricopeptide repeat protein n=1 Tax=Dactylosporangium aurantiacum TaxID=35754 RepID=A0A9Q9ISW2_9ACTN|nr:hypothetical protein [Dactylosporangium aurantiacum]MDG6107616.1 hypothetical protein [Dactylosporangium aurantiacum]UWZ58785.1 hypothetical protein Daura_23020 [Dactylosporangium aurantiacum]